MKNKQDEWKEVIHGEIRGIELLRDVDFYNIPQHEISEPLEQEHKYYTQEEIEAMIKSARTPIVRSPKLLSQEEIEEMIKHTE